jgi:hypothetical protein
MRIRSRLDRLMKCLGPGPRIAAAVVDEASRRVLQVLRGPCGFEPAPGGLSVGGLPRGCKVYLFDVDVCLSGCVDPRTGAAAVTAVRGIDLDVVLGSKPGLSAAAAPAVRGPDGEATIRAVLQRFGEQHVEPALPAAGQTHLPSPGVGCEGERGAEDKP